MDAPTIALVGGDERSRLLAAQLQGQGLSVGAAALAAPGVPALTLSRALSRAVVVLPTPLTRDGATLVAPDSERELPLADLLAKVRPGARLIGGGIPEEFRRAAKAKGCPVHDLLADEGVARANAVPTAEGALALAMEHSDITLAGARCVVVGSGRCGRALAVRLRALGARVTLTARKGRHHLWAICHGLRPQNTVTLSRALSDCDFLFNTVPAPVVDEEVLAALPPSALIIELASGRAGVDFAAAQALGRRALYAPGLPGKVAPRTAAAILGDAVTAILREEYPWINCD